MNEDDFEDSPFDERELEPDELFFWFVTGLGIPFGFYLTYCYLMPA